MKKFIPQNWRYALDLHVCPDEWRDAIKKLNIFLKKETTEGHRYHPRGGNIFNALREVDFDKVRVVIIGIDPYPNEADATGVAFSIPIDRDMTKSVAMIYCAIATDLSGKIPIHGNLDHWTQQDILLLNRVLTYRSKIQTIDPRTRRPYTKKVNEPEHKKHDVFTRIILKALSEDKTRYLHFIIWGGEERDVEKIKECIDGRHHHIHTAPHPAIQDSKKFEEFRKCGHFSAVNAILKARGEKPINWLPQSSFCSWLSALFY